MPIDVPQLDDTTYDDLVTAARSRLAAEAPAWTDHNASDPGVTVLELLAWLTETYVYQLDRVTDAHRLKYLALVGERPASPRPATATLELVPGADGSAVPGGTTLVVADERPPDGDADALFFETVAPAEGAVVAPTTARLAAVVSDYEGGRTDNLATNGTADVSYLAFGPDAERGSALYLGFDADPFTGGADGTVGTADTGTPALSLGVALDPAVHGPVAEHGDEPPAFDPSAVVAWERCTDYGEWYDGDAWAAVDVLADGTAGLYGDGLVALTPPAGGLTAGELFDRDPLYWLRCVVRTPAGEPGHETPPRVDAVTVNAVRAHHRRTVRGERLVRTDGRGTTTAHPGQAFAFAHAPVLDAAVTVDGEAWTRVDDFDGAGPDDRVYVLDPEAGTIRFGDDVTGGVPPAGAAVEATWYHHGGGSAGNGHRDASWRFADDALAGVAVRPLGGATGGADAESVADALDRARRDLRTPYRAVTRADYRFVTRNTPGVRVARAEAFVDGAEASDAGDCPPSGVVRVVVVPESTRPRPEPTPGLVRAVSCHLGSHRLLTDRVSVEPPAYTGVGVRAEVTLEPGYVAEERTAAAAARLDAFLHPLTGYDGDGWPLGRPVYRSEVYETLETVEGIDCVHAVDLTATGAGTVEGGDVRLGGTGLPYAAGHEVRVARDPEGCGEAFR